MHARTAARATCLVVVLLCGMMVKVSDAAGSLQPGAVGGEAPVKLDASKDVRQEVSSKKATCPFIGSLVKLGLIDLYNSEESPLGLVRALVREGNSGPGSDLGDLLYVFATGNHACPQGAFECSTRVPLGFFSLDFPGSQGSHAGHSGILQGLHTQRNSGRFSQADWERLVEHSVESIGRRYLTVKSVGAFIAGHMRRDTSSQLSVSEVLREAGKFVKTIGPALWSAAKKHGQQRGQVLSETERTSLIALTKTLGTNNLVGSSGEFGLLFALLTNSPKTTKLGKYTALDLTEVESLFKFRGFPVGWLDFPKKISDWSLHTAGLAWQAEMAYRKEGARRS